MGWLRRFLALAVIAGASVFAAPLPAQAAVSNVVGGMTYDDIVQWSNSQFARQATFGRYVRWGGGILLGAALVSTALDYFYKSLQYQTGTSLDSWMEYYDAISAWTMIIVSIDSCQSYTQYSKGIYYKYLGSSASAGTPPSSGLIAVGSECLADQLGWVERNTYPSCNWVRDAGVRFPDGTIRRYPSVCPNIAPRPPLPDWLQTHPDAANGIRTAVNRYVQDNPPQSRSNPYPGVQLDPVPNPNQWTDNPYADLTTDTDGDGWPDWMEKQRPWPDGIVNPNSYPDPNRDDDGDGYTNQEEKQAGTDPFDPKSKPGRDPGADSDGDGYPDDQELRCGSNPNDSSSTCQGQPKPGDEPEWPGAPGSPDLPGLQQPNTPSLPQFQPPRLPQTPWDTAMQSMRESIESLKTQAMDKFPFGVVRWLRLPSTSDSGGCPTPELRIGQFSANVNICGNPVWSAATQLRPLMLGGLLLTFAFTIVRRGLDVQR